MFGIVCFQRINRLYFISYSYQLYFIIISGLGTKEGRQHLTMKTFRAFRYVYKHYFDDFDWFMRTDDDSYVIMENLRYFLSQQDTHKAIHFGKKFKAVVKKGFVPTGPGCIFSKEALKRFSSSEAVKICPEADLGPDDVNIGRCFERLRKHGLCYKFKKINFCYQLDIEYRTLCKNANALLLKFH